MIRPIISPITRLSADRPGFSVSGLPLTTSSGTEITIEDYRDVCRVMSGMVMRSLRNGVKPTIHPLLLWWIQEPKGQERWQHVDVTMKLGTGDCEDIVIYCVLWLWLVCGVLSRPEVTGLSKSALKIHAVVRVFRDQVLPDWLKQLIVTDYPVLTSPGKADVFDPSLLTGTMPYPANLIDRVPLALRGSVRKHGPWIYVVRPEILS